MARRMLTREVTFTTVKVAYMEIQDGVPVAVALPDETLLGNVRVERAQRLISQKYKGKNVTVLEVEANTKVYEMPVEEFIQLATEKVEKDEVEQN